MKKIYSFHGVCHVYIYFFPAKLKSIQISLFFFSSMKVKFPSFNRRSLFFPRTVSKVWKSYVNYPLLSIPELLFSKCTREKYWNSNWSIDFIAHYFSEPSRIKIFRSFSHSFETRLTQQLRRGDLLYLGKLNWIEERNYQQVTRFSKLDNYSKKKKK